MGHRSLRDHLKGLEAHGLLNRIDARINKDTELMPLVRWQYRGLPPEQRRAFLFTNVTDARGRTYEGESAVATIGASREVYAVALDCRVEEIRERWIRSQSSPIDPVLVDGKGTPVKEVILRGDEVRTIGLDRFPIPISTPGFDPAPYVTSGAWVTKDPETGIRNVGNYRGMVKAPDRTGLQMFPSQHDGIHWAKWKAMGAKYMEAAIVIGPPPSVNLVAVAKIPYGVDEYTIAGGMCGFPIELVKCETVDLEVPAEAEVVLEGRIPTDFKEPEAPFGEFTGYVGERTMHPVFEITCITHRRRPIWHGFISQFPPSESSLVRAVGNESNYYHTLKTHCSIGSVLDVVFHEPTGAHFIIIIRLKKQFAAQPFQAMQAAAALDPAQGKVIIAVDEDIDPYDMDSVLWAVSTRMQPHLDMQVILNRVALLDPSSAPPDSPPEEQFFPQPRGTSSVLIDATRKWSFPPISLPKEPFMRRARELWEQLGLPPLTPRRPWFGYPLGNWPAEWAREAELALEGRYFETGETLARQRRPV
jgi:4-hydroxy-3-polyprenylbenzoate decarboxylase